MGSNLALLQRQEDPAMRVTALDNLRRRGSELNLPRLRDAGVHFLHGDVRTPEDLEAVGPFDVMLECSAEPSVLAGYGESPAYLLGANLTGAVNCLEACRKVGADMIFLSTSRVYPMHVLAGLEYEERETRLQLAAGQKVPGVSVQGVAEEFPLQGARTLYGATKLAAELLMAEYGEMYGLRCVINRCGVLAGPWQMGKVDQGFMALWAAAHVYGMELAYIGYGGKGKQVRDVLHVEDLFALLTRQMEAMDSHAGQTWNVGGGPDNSVSLAELTQMVQAASGNHISIAARPETRQGDVPWYVSDCRRVQEATGWAPARDVPAIVDDLVRWIRDNHEMLRPLLAAG